MSSNYTLRNLRRHVAVVTQQVTLFNDTVASNIAYGDLAGAPRAAIESAAEAAFAREFIDLNCRRASTPWSARTACCCPAASASAWRSPARC
jgi:ABC-type transport system involved in cytochrome bd biosynthesis fused ATPase/permease subunit